MTKRSVIAVAAIAGASLALTACAGAPAEPENTVTTINIEQLAASTTFDPATAAASADVIVARLGFDTLLRQAEDGLIGGLATEWEAVSASEYVFTIRDDATCSDGTAITPSIVKASLDYLATVDASSAQTLRSQVFGTGTPTFTADDEDGTLTIELSAPYAQLLPGMSREGTGVICPAGLADLEGLAAGTVEGAWSGPYTLTDFSAGVSATYTLRDDYDAWPAWTSVEGVPAETINISVSSDPNTSANLLEAGGIDVGRFFDSNAERFTDSEEFSYVSTPSSAYTLVFNEAPGSGSIFVDDQPLRAAVAQAISAEGFNDAGLDGLGTPLLTTNASTYQCALNEPELLQEFDPEAASELLTGKTIRLLTMSNWAPAVDFLAESLRAAGATVEVSSPDPAEWISQMRTSPTTWDVALGAEGTSTGLISLSINRYVGPSYLDGGVNAGAADNPEGYELLQEGLAAADADERCELFLDAQRTILERVDVAPLVTDTHFFIAREGFATYVFSGYWDISALRIV